MKELPVGAFLLEGQKVIHSLVQRQRKGPLLEQDKTQLMAITRLAHEYWTWFSCAWCWTDQAILVKLIHVACSLVESDVKTALQ